MPIAGDLQLREHRLGRLSANAEPVLSALGINANGGRIRVRVVVADLFNHAAITLLARIDDDDTVLGRTDLAHALQTNFDCHLSGHAFLTWVEKSARWGYMRAPEIPVNKEESRLRGTQTFQVQPSILPESKNK